MSTPKYYLASFPRSGNTMTRLMLHAFFGVDSPSPHKERGNLAHRILWNEKHSGIRLQKTHELLPAEEVSGAIVLARDGRDAIVSHTHFVREISRVQQPFNGLLRKLCRNGGWTQFYEHWLTIPNIALVKYEHLVDPARSPVAILGEALERIGLHATEDPSGKMPTFAELAEDDHLFFRRGQTGSWRDEMSKNKEQVFWRYNGHMMTTLGYER